MMEQPWLSLVFWHIALPLVGAVLFLLARRREPRVGRTIVLANVVGSLMLAALMIATYFSHASQAAIEAGRPRMSSRIAWLSWEHEEAGVARNSGRDEAELSGPSTADVMLSVGVDGLSLWFLAAIPLIVLCLLLTDTAETWCERPLPIAALLVAESAALAVFAARDVVLLSAALAALAFANFVVVGSQGRPGIRAAARALLLQQLGATALMSISLLGAVVACSHMLGAPHAPPQPPSFDLDQLILEVRRLTSQSPPAQLVWRQLAPWLFLSLVVGCCVWSGAFPFHVTNASALRNSSPAGRALLGGITLNIGAYGLIRIALPLFPALMASLGPLLLLWLMLSALYCAVSMHGGRIDATRGLATASLGPAPTFSNRRVFLAEGAIVIALLSMCGVISQTVPGVVGASLLLVAHAVCWMLYVLSSAETGSNARPRHQQPRGGWILVMLALAGIPGLALFPGLLLMFLGISASPATAESWLAMLLLYWLVIAISGWAHLEQARGPVTAGNQLTTSARLAAALLIAMILLIGIAPGIFTGPIQEGVMEILGQQPM